MMLSTSPRSTPRLDRLLLFALILTAAMNIFPTATDFWRYTYDGETHLFFADHYRRGWWDAWEEKWHQGFWVYSYPPLVHQLIALVGRVSSLEAGYRLVQSVALVLYPVAAWSLSREIQGVEAAGLTSLLTLAPAGVYLALYSFGQLPTVVGIVIMLFALAALARYLREGRPEHLLGWGLFAGTLFSAHHLTAAFGLLPAAVCVVLHSVGMKNGSGRSSWISRLTLAGLTLAASAVLAIIPFWWWALTQREALAEIPHPTRLQFLLIPEFRDLFFLREYGLSLLFLPLVLLWPIRNRKRWSLTALLVAWMVLGLGGNTTIPRQILGGFWTYMIYDRFTLLAAAFSPLAAGEWLTALHGRARQMALVALLIPAVMVSASAAAYTRSRDLLPPLKEWEQIEMRRFLEADNHSDWYYITLGLGDNEFQHLSRMTSARTIDGYYTTARIRKELRESRAGSFDGSLHFPDGLAELKTVLARPAEWNLKWALVRDPRYEPLLKESGWTRGYPIGSDSSWEPGEAVYSTVMIWYVLSDPSIPVLRDNALVPPAPLPVLWGIMPLAFLVGAVYVSARGLRQARRVERSESLPLESA